MLSTSLRASLFVTLAAVGAACGGSAPPPATTPAAPTDSSAAAASAAPAAAASSAAPASDATAPSAWSKTAMTKEQQAAFMKTKVMPALTPVFKGHDAAKYGEFGCKTCHGHPFQDPHDFLPHLTFSGGSITQCKDKGDVCKFMHEQVEPGMATVLGQQPYDMKTNTGFGCKGCHTVDMK